MKRIYCQAYLSNQNSFFTLHSSFKNSIHMHRYLSLDTLFERNKSLGSHNTRNTLQLVVEKRHELLVVAGIQFDEHSIWSCGEVTLHNLRDMNETLYHFLVHRSEEH